jgi:hypothetical protein
MVSISKLDLNVIVFRDYMQVFDFLNLETLKLSKVTMKSFRGLGFRVFKSLIVLPNLNVMYWSHHTHYVGCVA